MRILRLVLILAAVSAALAPDLAAQKMGRSYREFPAFGFKFKPLDSWMDVPVAPDDKESGVIAQLDAERGVYVKVEGNSRPEFKPSLLVVKVDPPKATTDGGGEGEGDGLRGKIDVEKGTEAGVREVILRAYRGGLREAEFKEVVPEIEDVKLNKEITLKHELYVTYMVYSNGIGVDNVLDCWVLSLADTRIFFLWTYPDQERKDWQKAVEKTMKTLRLTDSVEPEVSSIDSDSSYDDILAYHANEVAQTPGWRVVETPSKRYLIKTNEEDKKKINEVIKRLEASREVFEVDFPPETPITHISVVRVCASQEEFHKYGSTTPGVAGWFSPRTTELVLFFDNNMGPDAVLEVMTHEGFHQYCHFLFGQTEAHRWFDEGTGDYYGGFDMKGSKLVPDADMSGGLKRAGEIKDMIRQGSVKPLGRHLRFDHGEWQSQGPSNVSGYAQSWSIIYFLRQGMRGKVSSKYWKKEYAEIIPNYIAYLSAGWKEAQAETIKKYADMLDGEGTMSPEDRARLEEQMRDVIAIMMRDPELRDKVWDRAIAESWGKIDEPEFEARWQKFVLDEL
ncbi:MAG: hypothetical protein O3A20_05445 [Planctomycetota bacterium]|nr:hypothetical protein [Planctomycetota bacterium]